MTQSLSIRPSAMRGRFAAALAVAVAAAVLVPLAQPAAASAASVVSVAAEFDKIYEGGTAVFTFTADPAPAKDLVVTYEVDESQYHNDSLTDAQTGTHTVTIPANQASVAVEIPVRPDTYYAWAGADEAWGQGYDNISGVALGNIDEAKYVGRYNGHYCKNNGSGLPWREEPPSGEGNHGGDTSSPFHPDNPRFVGRFKYANDTLNEKKGDAIPDVKQGDRQCSIYDFNHYSNKGEVRVKITSVSAGGRKADKPPVVFTKVVDRSLWTDKLDIVHTSGSTSVAENGGTDTYSVALTGRPSSNVTVTVRSHKPEAAKVTDDDAANVAIDLSTDLTSISEDAGAQTVTVSINKAPAQDIQIGYTVSSNSAVQDVDFVGLDGDIKFDGGTSTLTRRRLVTVLNDTLPSEGPETVTITLTDGAGYRLGAQASVTITIDDNT